MFGAASAWITSAVADRFVITDELLYEPPAPSIEQTRSRLRAQRAACSVQISRIDFSGRSGRLLMGGDGIEPPTSSV
jgi:hypothetical protein